MKKENVIFNVNVILMTVLIIGATCMHASEAMDDGWIFDDNLTLQRLLHKRVATLP